MLDRLLGNRSVQRSADALYGRAVEQARQPFFYKDFGVSDTVDGRFEMISLHVFLILHRLKQDSGKTHETAQAVFDAMFTDMDRGLRELGAGDLGVGRRVKAMAKAFYGRVAAYEQGLISTDADLTAAVLRNIFRGQGSDAENASLLSSYISAQVKELSSQPIEALLRGKVIFGAAVTGKISMAEA